MKSENKNNKTKNFKGFIKLYKYNFEMDFLSFALHSACVRDGCGNRLYL